ncbi:MAG: polyphosphate kinase 1 [Chloroflexi bacterium]|nr:MAG: polyphosphate kinase 1 [Chloroflexota bacterium]
MVSTSKSHYHDRDLFRPDLYINREVSAVNFIRRVLEEAGSIRHPLLERVKFLSFVSRQIDEFLMIRVAGLQDQQIAQVKEVGPDGMLPGQQLDELRGDIVEVLSSQHRCWVDELLPQLREAGVAILNYSELTRAQREAAASYYSREVFPILTPLGVDPAHPFPHISSRSLNLAVTLSDPQGIALFARVKVPSLLPRLVPVPTSARDRARHPEPETPRRYAFVWIEQVITAHLDSLFPGMVVNSAYPFRVLRDADFDIQRDQAGDLLETVEQNVQLRRFGVVVNLTVQPDMPESIRDMLREHLELDQSDVMELEEPLGLGDLFEICDIDRPDLKDQPIVATVPSELRRSTDLFSAIQKSDLLLHHPYNTFSTVAEFIETAARDSQVVAIKQTLYRVGQNSRIVDALLEANDRGKQVAVLVELKARFDEENNIEWARRLERAGVHVVYGQVDLKTHAKVALVVRREAGGLRRYVHIGTGNYNASTARVYEDYALLTCRPEIGEDASHLFNAMTGYSRGVVYNKLVVAPDGIRPALLQRIEREIERHQVSGKGRLIFKVNALVDPEFIRALYRASRAGVQIDLIVRGMCCLRPGIPGISENIRVVSLVGRFLEHSRIYYFANGGIEEEEILIGSADLMQRNLDHRVEVLVPVEDASLRAHFRDVALPTYLRDTANARRLLSNGAYERVVPAPGEDPFDEQIWFSHHGTGRSETEAMPLLFPVRAD